MIVVDVETTGVIPGKNGIVSIGAVEFEKPTNQFYGECKIDKQTVIDPIALEINGFSEKQLFDSKKPTRGELITQFHKWKAPIKDTTVAGQNVTFDLRMLWAAYLDAPDLKPGLTYRSVDLFTLVYAHMKKTGKLSPSDKMYTDDLHKYLGLPEEPKPHNGLTGAKMEAEAISRLIYGKSLLKEYAKHTIPKYLQS